MSREIMMQEQLSAHEVEWEVVRSPAQEEKASGVVKSGPGRLTNGLLSSSTRNLICCKHSCKNSGHSNGKPPAKGIA